MDPKERIIVALDTPDFHKACWWVRQLAQSVGAFKVGLEFLTANGPEGVRELIAEGANRIFHDRKFSDIPNTMRGAVRSAMKLRPWMLNVHAMAGPDSMRAAMEAAQCHPARPLVIAVTVLTSLDDKQLRQIGIEAPAAEQVVRLAKLAQECGLDGVVASPQEIELIREACGPDFLIVTPGIRPAGTDVHDQKRTGTPGAAVAAGADYLVVGRALTESPDPRAAALAIADEIAAATAHCPGKD